MDCIFFISCFTGSLLLGSVCIVSLSLSVHHYWPDLHCFISCFIGSSLLGLYCFTSITGSSYSSWFALFHFILLRFIITEHGLYFFTSCLISSSLLIMVYIFSLHASLVRQNWKWFILLHLKTHWFIITGHCIVSLHVSLVHHHWAWFASFDYAFHWFFLTGHGLHCFTSCFTGSFLQGIVCIFPLPSLFHHYWA